MLPLSGSLPVFLFPFLSTSLLSLSPSLSLCPPLLSTPFSFLFLLSLLPLFKLSVSLSLFLALSLLLPFPLLSLLLSPPSLSLSLSLALSLSLFSFFLFLGCPPSLLFSWSAECCLSLALSLSVCVPLSLPLYLPPLPLTVYFVLLSTPPSFRSLLSLRSEEVDLWLKRLFVLGVYVSLFINC